MLIVTECLANKSYAFIGIEKEYEKKSIHDLM